MRILFISEYYPPIIMGGGEINLAQIAQELARQKHEIIVLTSYFPTLATEEVVQGVTILRKLKTGMKTSTLGGNFQRRFFFPRSIRREAHKVITTQNPDIIHFIGTSIIAAPEIKKYHQKLFATIESYPTLCPKGDRLYHGKKECIITCTAKEFVFCQQESQEIGKMKNKWYLKYNPLFLAYTYHYYTKLNTALSSCTLISISKYVQQLLLQQNHQSTIIPNILDVDAFACVKKKNQERSAEKENKKPQILYLGSLIQSKGPKILLEALKGIDCRCDLYGEGNLKSELQEYIEKNNLDAEIHPPVPYDRIPELYAQTDIVVFPSIWPEPFGRIVIEAQAAGKIIIGSRVGAIGETVLPSGGILVKPGNHPELRQAIKEGIEKKIKFRDGIGGLQKYSSPNVTTKLISIYQETMKHG